MRDISYDEDIAVCVESIRAEPHCPLRADQVWIMLKHIYINGRPARPAPLNVVEAYFHAHHIIEEPLPQEERT